MTDKEKLEKLCDLMSKSMASDLKKEERYIEFLKKYNFPLSGPTPIFLSRLDSTQRKELGNIFI